MTKVIYILGFIVCSVLFVHVNAQVLAETGGWNDLEWLGVPTIRALPSVSMGFSFICDTNIWLLFNLIVILIGGFCEHKLLRDPKISNCIIKFLDKLP